MIEHTPGPWMIDRTKAFGPCAIVSMNLDWPHDKRIVCSFDDDRRQDKEDRPRLEADASLIAAAPDLLSACVAMLGTWGSDDEDAIIQARDMARAAIFKAHT